MKESRRKERGHDRRRRWRSWKRSIERRCCGGGVRRIGRGGAKGGEWKGEKGVKEEEGVRERWWCGESRGRAGGGGSKINEECRLKEEGEEGVEGVSKVRECVKTGICRNAKGK